MFKPIFERNGPWELCVSGWFRICTSTCPSSPNSQYIESLPLQNLDGKRDILGFISSFCLAPQSLAEGIQTQLSYVMVQLTTCLKISHHFIWIDWRQHALGQLRAKGKEGQLFGRGVDDWQNVIFFSYLNTSGFPMARWQTLSPKCHSSSPLSLTPCQLSSAAVTLLNYQKLKNYKQQHLYLHFPVLFSHIRWRLIE